MIAYLKAKLALFIVLLIAVPLLIGGIYYYYTAMKVKQGSLNINKVTSEYRVYSYSVFSDFYFRVTKYGQEGEAGPIYSEVIPIETRIGYDFNSNELMLQKTTPVGNMILNDMKLGEIPVVKVLKDFAKTFGEIVATQDQYYFDKSMEGINDINEVITGRELAIKSQKVSDYYEENINLPITNMKVQPFLLSEIMPNLKGDVAVAPVDQWRPNLIKYQFGDDDRIYLQYLTRFKNGDVEDFIKDEKQVGIRKGSLIVNTVKFHGNALSKLAFKISVSDPSKGNEVEAYFMDSNGYVYLLKYVAYNKASFDRYLPDFLKIAYSISFVDVKNFENWFANEQESMEYLYALYLDDLLNIKFLDEKLKSKGLLEHFGLEQNNAEIVAYKHLMNFIKPPGDLLSNVAYEAILSLSGANEDDIQRSLFGYISFIKFDEAFDWFLQQHGHYPNGSEREELSNELIDKRLLLEASEQSFEKGYMSGLMNSFSKSKKRTISDRCPDIECVRELKKNDWKEWRK